MQLQIGCDDIPDVGKVSQAQVRKESKQNWAKTFLYLLQQINKFSTTHLQIGTALGLIVQVTVDQDNCFGVKVLTPTRKPSLFCTVNYEG